jgi:hypothetical protein
MDNSLQVCEHRDTPGAGGEMARRPSLEMTWNQLFLSISLLGTVLKKGQTIDNKTLCVTD